MAERTCTICGSPDTNKKTCPLNPLAKQPSHKNHPFAARARKAQKAQKPDDASINLMNIRRMQGPIGMTLLKPTPVLNDILGRQAPDILLLDDMHVGNKKCDNCTVENGCYSLYEDGTFLKHIDNEARRTAILTDLFLEYWKPIGFERDADIQHNSSLMETIFHTMKCRPGEDTVKCPYKNIRVHMGDMREADAYTATSKNYLAESIYRIYAETLSDPPEIFVAYCKRRFPKVPVEHIMSLIHAYFSPDVTKEDIYITYWTDIFFTTYSRIHKEVLQLPEPLRHALIKFTKPIEDEMDIARKQPLGDSAPIKFQPILSASMPDIYILARLLKTPTGGGKPSQFGIIYLGAIHTKSIIKKLTHLKYYTIKKQSGVTQPDILEYVMSLQKKHKYTQEELVNAISNMKCFFI